MNLLYMKYAVEVASAGSINRAAERLYVDQPNLSRAIKDLETSLGVSLFERSARGMKLTPDGETFLRYAKTILSEVDAVENMFRTRTEKKQEFSISVPRASYISAAFAAFARGLPRDGETEIFYKETNAMRAMKNILENDYRLGIVRYAETYDRYYKTAMEEKGLAYEIVTEFRYNLLFSKDSPLAQREHITLADLGDYTEIAHADPYVPSLPFAEVKKEELPDVGHRIFVFERGSEFDLLQNPDTFMWASPVPEEILRRNGLISRPVQDNGRIYKDVLIYREDYKLTRLDNAFITELCRVKRETFHQMGDKL